MKYIPYTGTIPVKYMEYQNTHRDNRCKFYEKHTLTVTTL